MPAIVAPRASVTLTPATAADFLRVFGELYNAVARAVQADAATAGPDIEPAGDVDVRDLTAVLRLKRIRQTRAARAVDERRKVA